MESDLRFFTRRAAAEMLAAKRSITQEARLRYLELAERYRALVRQSENAPARRAPLARDSAHRETAVQQSKSSRP